jgi:hypothetical protein
VRLRAITPVALVLVLTGCGHGTELGNAIPPQITVDGLRMPARVHGGAVEAATADGFRPRFWAGVNLGSTTPGHLPGEVAATRHDYDRWIWQMGRLGVSTVRVYTILRPSFYDALRAYDIGHPDHPIMLIQGVWIPEDAWLSTGDAYAPAVTYGFKAEIADAVGVVHGTTDLSERAGHASGSYRSDVTPWLLAWSIGVEWDQKAVKSTDRLEAGRPAFHGRYFTSDASSTPMESWLASMLDYTASLEADRGWSMPLTFTNWLTTDPLPHPYEPLHREDAVSIDAMHIAATKAWPGGFFASYHAYPYYPDFLRRTPRYAHAADPYSAYLRDLRRHHRGQAVMITEFGVPTGIGVAHRGPLGRNQGGHTELEAGSMDADMLRDIRRDGYAGGMLFEWLDEWFKFTWNTWDLEQPAERRALWRNALTNEEQFGLIAADTRGQAADGGTVIAGAGSGPGVQQVRASHDEEYLYLRLRFDRPQGWRRSPVTVGFDVRPGENRGLPGTHGADPAADVALRIGSGDSAHLVQAAWTDSIAWQYGVARSFVPVHRADLEQGSGVWDAPRLILNRPTLIRPEHVVHPTELVDVGTFRWGDWAEPTNLVRAHGDAVDVRIPWMLLTFADPSSHLVYRVDTSGVVTTEKVGTMGISLAGANGVGETSGYAWPGWNTVQWHERRKAGWTDLRSAMLDPAGGDARVTSCPIGTITPCSAG